MAKLTDTQHILLSTASQRESGSILPLPSCLTANGGTGKVVTALFARGFAEEREAGSTEQTRRTEGEQRFGAFITAAGLAAIGVEDRQDGESPASASDLTSTQAAAAPRTSKAGAVLALLQRDGATLAPLIEATGWLPHTTRAALTGLRKKGHAIDRAKRDGVTCYRIVVAG